MALLSSSQVSHQDFQSQVPFQTQYRPAQSSRAAQVTEKSNTKWQKNPKATQDSGAERVKSPTASEHEITSSGGSIACEPLTAPQTAVKSAVRISTSTLRPSAQQPFPLVDWIRRIREDTQVEHPTLPLRWCRSISRQQQAILDTDDAWSPPLPGRPARQGTVPIEILQALTDQVDHDVQTKHTVEVQAASHVASRASPTRSIIEQPRTTQSSLPSPVLTVPTASQAESAVAWSSSPPSPPRRLLPPDTSPVRPPSKQRPGFSKISPADTPVGQSDTAISARLSSIRETMPSPPADTHLSQSIDDIWSRCPGTASQRARTETKRRRTNGNTHQDVSGLHPRENLPSTSFMQPPKTVARRRSEILVKHTPYPPKATAKNHNRNLEMDELPHSSLVTGTYPDSVTDNRGFTFSRRLEPMPASQPLPAYTLLPANKHSGEMEDQPSQRSLKRPRQVADHEATAALQRSRASPIRGNGSNTDESDDSPPSKQSKTLHSRSLSAASKFTEQSESSSDPEYKARLERDRIQRKIERRRAVRREMSKRKPENTSERLQPPGSTQVQERVLAPSVLSSIISSRTNRTILPSEHNGTPITAASKHGVPPLSEDPEPAGHAITELFQRFVSTYTEYDGNSRSFEIALRLLLSHNLHQSLYDDFIFRMADEYQAYRQECFEKDEDVLSYRNYYDSYVEDSGCRNKVVTKKSLEILTVQFTGMTAGPQKAPNMPPSEVLSARVDLRTPGRPDARRDVERPTIHDFTQLQPSPASQGALSTEHTPTVDHPRKVRASEASDRSGSYQETRKRRSLPWASDGRPQVNAAMVIQSTQTQVPPVSTEFQGLTTSVEGWLGRPAGACSPEIEVAPSRTPAVKNASIGMDALSTANKNEIVALQRGGLKASDLQVLKHPTVQGVTFVKDIDETSLTTMPSTKACDNALLPGERPVTQFQLFARTFANLLSEKPMQSLPINAYNW